MQGYGTAGKSTVCLVDYVGGLLVTGLVAIPGLQVYLLT